jgi:hypothetical protein
VAIHCIASSWYRAAVSRRAARAFTAAVVACLGLAFACGPSLPPPEVNVAYGAPVASASASTSSSAPTWPHLAELKTFTHANGRRFTSKGHYFGRLDADVFVNAVAAPVYSALQPGVSLPEGGIVVKVHRALNGDAPGPMLAIEKRTEGNVFVEMDAFGHVQREGRIEPCVGCHAQVAGQGEMFGIPVNGR